MPHEGYCEYAQKKKHATTNDSKSCDCEKHNLTEVDRQVFSKTMENPAQPARRTLPCIESQPAPQCCQVNFRKGNRVRERLPNAPANTVINYHGNVHTKEYFTRVDVQSILQQIRDNKNTMTNHGHLQLATSAT
eukprot:5934912-Amphidinium_carterae.1